ncbi:PfkB family carbohydrate kinase [Tistrella mobilis]|uniref:PfkB family carbohydrate kinase n=1 Tax=Tistrella mobilis TaxID=171437 RepID=UPI0031F6BA25
MNTPSATPRAPEPDGRVLVFGSVNQDLVLACRHLPTAGETVAARDPLHLPGGKGGNQAFAAARAGARVSLIAAVGDDAAADIALGGLAAAGCDMSSVIRTHRPTGLAIVAVGPRRAGDDRTDNQIIVSPGANDDLNDTAVADALLTNAVLVTQNETPAAGIGRLHARAAASGAVVVHNAAPARGADELPLAPITHLVVNETEWAAFAGATLDPDAPDTTLAAAIRSGRSAAGLRPDQLVVMTLGAAGALVADAAGLIRQPSAPVPVVDSTGAGDAFVGAYAAALARGAEAARALAEGVAAGGLACAALGARAATPDAAAIRRAAAALPAARRIPLAPIS